MRVYPPDSDPPRLLNVLRYRGSRDVNSSTTAYFSIPYAFASRFDKAKPIEDKPGLLKDVVIDASKHGPACTNFNLPPPYDKGFAALLGEEAIEPQSEDCLTIDIYVPDGDHDDLPVYFWTPGGGFLVGSSFSYDMGPLVGNSVDLGMPVIAVSINYRLGPLGFLNPSTFGWDSTNLGLLDQIEALRWVRPISIVITDKGAVRREVATFSDIALGPAEHSCIWWEF